MDKEMIKIFRTSDKGLDIRIPGITKAQCLNNFMKTFENEQIYIIADNVSDNTYNSLKQLDCEDVIRINKGNSGSLKFAFEFATTFSLNETVYFCEDDFLHKSNPEKYIQEGLTIADYVSLYDHLDKYQTGGQNPFIKNGGEETIVRITESSHWKYTNSTVQTFATRVSTLTQDMETLHQYNFLGPTPDSFRTFLMLREQGRQVATCIPGRSTHCDHYPSPLTDWVKLAKDY